MNIQRVALLVLWTSLAVSAAAQGGTKARLLVSAETVRPGEAFMAAIELKMPPRWHTYWRHPGDSGGATTIEWDLPSGVRAGALQWPVPEKYLAFGMTTYVYHDTVLLPVPLEVASDVDAGPLQLRGKVSWLECEELCIPGSASVEGRVIVGSETKPSDDAERIAQWQEKVPRDDAPAVVRAQWKEPDGNSRPLIIEWPDSTSTNAFDFFPYKVEDAEISGDTEVISPNAIQKKVSRFGERWPAKIRGVIVPKNEGRAFEVAFDLGGPEALDEESATGTPSGATGPAASLKEQPLWLMLVFAFIGGLILNVMPCVLPVISLKILGFVNQSREHPRRVRQLGMVFVLGVLVSFLAMAALVIAAKQAGPANWGMQFQNPFFLVAMTILIVLVALNLFGLFEVRLGGKAMGAAGTLASKEGFSGSFFNGVLATILATPCTAPFLAAALGFAFAQPAAIVLLMFATIGLGLAAPYLLLSIQPRWLRFLPKPGRWMERFKVAMGFPMLATALWLFSLTARHFGTKGMLWFGIFLVMVGLAAWVWGEFVQRGHAHRVWAALTAGIILFGGYWFTMEAELNWRSAEARVTEEGIIRSSPDGIPWRPWSRAAVEEARRAGHPVLVDFTADWCLTCQANKRSSLEIPSVRQRLAEINGVAFLADYTLKDPVITKELQRYDRAGVPLVLVYPADLEEPPIVLPAFLTPGIVLEALGRAAANGSPEGISMAAVE